MKLVSDPMANYFMSMLLELMTLPIWLLIINVARKPSKRSASSINSPALWSEMVGFPIICISNVGHSLCNVHLLRDLTFIGEAYPDNNTWTDTFAKLLIEIKDAVETAVSQEKTQLETSLQTDLLDRYDSILIDAEATILSSPDGMNKLLSAPSLHRRLMREKDLILRFMTDFRVPFDNNGSERDLRMIKLQQKISGCFRSIGGVKVFCRVRSYLSSARKQGRGLLTAIESALKRKSMILIA
jgi:transposase